MNIEMEKSCRSQRVEGPFVRIRYELDLGVFKDALSIWSRRSQLFGIDYISCHMLTFRDQIGDESACEDEFELCGSRLGYTTQNAVSLAEDRSARIPERAGIDLYLTQLARLTQLIQPPSSLVDSAWVSSSSPLPKNALILCQ